MLKPTNEMFEWLRRSVLAHLSILVQVYDSFTDNSIYITAETSPDEFVGRVEMDEPEVEKLLDEIGFVRNPLAALKTHEVTGEQEEGSFRWLGEWHDDYDDDFQLHVILYDGSQIPNADTGETYIYAHWEYRWDVAPIKHYQTDGYDSDQSVDMMEQMLDARNVEYDRQKPFEE